MGVAQQLLSCFTGARHEIKSQVVRKKAAIVLLLALLCYILGLVTAFYFPIPAHVGAVLTTVLRGKIRPFVVKRNFSETIGYVTDRKVGPLLDGNVTFLGEYAGQASYGVDNGPSTPASSDRLAARRSRDQKSGVNSLSGISEVPSRSVRKTFSHLDPRLPAFLSSQHRLLRTDRTRLKY